MSSLLRRAVALALCLTGATTSAGQEPAGLVGESTQTRKRLAEAEQKLLAGKTAEATDDLQRIIDEAGNDLIAVDGKQYLPARRLAHQLLSRLPADALKSYQDRIDDPASRLLAAARKTRDAALLRQLLERYFVSRPAEEGIQMLGDLLFEQGEFLAAERQWRRLLPDAGADLVYPGSRSTLAGVRARTILAVAFQGETERARRDLQDFQAKHPGAAGLLAGKTGTYAATLQPFVDHPPAFALPAETGNEWPGFGGGPGRSSRVASRIEGSWPASPTRKLTIPASAVPRHRNAPIGPPGRPPFCHPVIANSRVYLTDGYRLLAFDLSTGKLAATLALAQPRPELDTEKPPFESSPCLTAAGGFIYVRVGPAVIRPSESAKNEDTSIACITSVSQPGGGTLLRKLWQLHPPVMDGKPAAVWEGAPLIAGRRMWAAYARFEGGRVVHGIACYDPADAASAPDRAAWSTDVCESAIGASDGRARHELLTLAGQNVVFSSSSGAVVAIDAATGKRAWAYRYSRARKADGLRSADPSPVVYSGGRIFAAPADGDRVFALDPDSGQLLWETGSTEGAQILGIAAGRVIVTSIGPVRGIRGLDMRTGSYRAPAGWIQHDGGGLLSYGRGFVTDDLIVWPTRSGLVFLDPWDGYPAHPQPIPGPTGGATLGCFGNIVHAEGTLVVVTPTEVLFYVSESRLFGDAGPTAFQSDGDPSRSRFEHRVRLAERALALGDRERARAMLLQVANSELAGPFRAWAAARVLLITSPVDAESKLPSDLRSALAPELLKEWLIAPDGMPETLGSLLDRFLGRDTGVTIPSATAPVTPGRVSSLELAPSLSMEAEIARTLLLPPGTAPMPWIHGATTPPRHLFAIGPSEMVAVAMTNRTAKRYVAADHFTQAADLENGFVAAGPAAVALYDSSRKPQWVFRVPTTDPLPSRPGVLRLSFGNRTAASELSSFRLHGSHLVARLGERHLIAFDLRHRRVAWVIGADGGSGYHPSDLPGARRFGPEIGATGRFVLAQVSNGTRWLISADSGKVREGSGRGDGTARVWWSSPPVALDAGSVLFADGPGLVRLCSLKSGSVRWSYQAEGESSLSGEPPQIRVLGRAIIVVVRRNHGIEVDCIGPHDGKSRWPEGPVFLDAGRIDLSRADADAEHIYLPAGKALTAVNLKSGKLRWEVELPAVQGAGDWCARAGQNCLIVHSTAAIPREPVHDILSRMVRSFRNEPSPWRLPGLVTGLYDAWIARSLPVLLLDPGTGKPVGRLDISAAGPAATAYFERDLAVVAVGHRVVWLR